MIGRTPEKQVLLNALESDKSEFVAVYGRRRVGKTYLIRETFDYRFTFQHTGLAKGRTKDQLFAFFLSLREAGYDDCPVPTSWIEAFSLLSTLLNNSSDKRKIVFIDELPWMDTPRSNFIPALEHFWNGWVSARKDILLIICGSATSWIISKVINDHGGLHNRLTQQISLKPFTLHECELFVQSKGLELSRYQILESYMVLGGIPYYWDMLEKGRSSTQNIDALFFARNGKLRNEFNKLYSSLFKNPAQYINIVTILGKKKAGMTRDEIIYCGAGSNNGQLSKVLKELEQCGFIRRYNSLGKKKKESIYQLMDNYTLFYFKFCQSNYNNDEHFWSASLGSATHRTWCGLAFERVCMSHSAQIKQKLGISGILSNVYSWRAVPKDGTPGGQIDMLIDRNDSTINLCEIKYSESEFTIDKKYEHELRNKKASFISNTGTNKAVHLTMITTYGLRHNPYSGIIQSEVTMDDLFV